MSNLDPFAKTILNTLSSHIAIIDKNGIIIAVNETWRKFSKDNSASVNVCEGANYLTTCTQATGRDADLAHLFASGLKDILSGKILNFSLEYPCHSSNENRYFQVHVMRLELNQIRYAIVAHENITARKLSERATFERTLEAELLHERSRLARNLHDSLSQTLTAASLFADSIPYYLEYDEKVAQTYLEEVISLSRSALSELHVLISELEPKALLRYSLPILIQQLVEQASARKPIQGVVDVEGNIFETSSKIKVNLYRILQEAVNNILRHSDAKDFNVFLKYDVSQITLIISDNGIGFPMYGATYGFGLMSMRDRAREICANFTLHSELDLGTTIQVNWNAN